MHSVGTDSTWIRRPKIRRSCGTRKTAGKRRVLLPQEIGLYFKMENVVLCLQSLDRIGGKIQTKTSSPQDPPLAMYYAAT